MLPGRKSCAFILYDITGNTQLSHTDATATMMFLRGSLVACSCSAILLSPVIVQCFQPSYRHYSWPSSQRRLQAQATTTDVTTTNYAGLLASFDATTGALLPVPKHYVPEAFVEWGMIPTTLEVLSSSSTSRSILQTIVLPETGCGVDNLETITTVEEHTRIADSTATMIRFPQSKNKRAYEVVFPYDMLDDLVEHDDAVSSDYRCRVRIIMANTSTSSLTYGPIEVVVERCVTAAAPSSIADTTGGGLDAQSVGRWLGGALNSKQWRAFGEANVAASETKGRLQLPLDLVVTLTDDVVEVSKGGSATVRCPLTDDADHGCS